MVQGFMSYDPWTNRQTNKDYYFSDIDKAKNGFFQFFLNIANKLKTSVRQGIY